MSTILAAIGIGVLVLLAGNMPFNVLRVWNFEIGVAVPWAVLPAAGLVGFGALVTLLAFAARLVALPASSPIVTPPGMPIATALALIVMASIVAGVTEEAAFRGYMQGPIERRYGLAAAILVNGTLFGLLHFPSHPADVLPMLPYYLAVSAVYGGLTWAANSILPALVSCRRPLLRSPSLRPPRSRTAECASCASTSSQPRGASVSLQSLFSRTGRSGPGAKLGV